MSQYDATRSMRIIKAILITGAYVASYGALYIALLVLGSFALELALPNLHRSEPLSILRIALALIVSILVLRHLMRNGKQLLGMWLLPIPVIIISILTMTGFLVFLDIKALHASRMHHIEMEKVGRQMQEYFERQDPEKLENFRPEDHMELIDELNRSLREDPANLDGDTLISPWRPTLEGKSE